MTKTNKKIVVLLLTFMTAIAMLAFGVNGGLAKADSVETDTLVSSFVMRDAASVRVTEPSGIRFESSMSELEYDTLISTYGADNVEIATLILPTVLLGNDTLDINTYERLKANKVLFDTKGLYQGNVLFRAVLTGIPKEYYGIDITAVTYLAVKDVDSGNTLVQYAKTDKGEKSVSRNILEVATQNLLNNQGKLNETTKNFLEDIVYANSTVNVDLTASNTAVKSNQAVVLESAVTVDDQASDSLSANLTVTGAPSSLTVSEDGKTVSDANGVVGAIVTENGETYFYSSVAGTYTITATVQYGNSVVTDHVDVTVSSGTVDKTLSSVVNASDNFELSNLYVKTVGEVVSDAQLLSLTLDYYGNTNNVLNISGTDTNLHNVSAMVNENRYATKGYELDFSNGLYLKLIKYPTNYTSMSVAYALFVSEDGVDYYCYAKAVYKTENNLPNYSFQTVKLSVNSPVYISDFTVGKTASISEPAMPEPDKLEIEFNATATTVRIGETLNLGANALFNGKEVATDIAYEIVSGEGITVENGVFNANAVGTFTVKASATYGEFTASETIVITVLDNELVLDVTDTVKNIKVGETSNIICAVTYNGNAVISGYQIEYRVMNGDGATIDELGVFSAPVGEYDVRVVVTYNGITEYEDMVIIVTEETADVIEVSLEETSSITRTNVGIVLYETVYVNGSVTAEGYTVEYSSNGGVISTIDGKQYFYSTTAGTYDVTATVTYNGVVNTATKSITVNGTTSVNTIYNINITPDAGSNYSQIVVSKEGYYYGKSASVEEQAMTFALNAANASTFTFSTYIKLLDSSDTSKNVFFTFFPQDADTDYTFFDGIVINGSTNTINIINLTSSKYSALNGATYTNSQKVLDFSEGVYLKFVRTVSGGGFSFELLCSTDGVIYESYAKTTSSNLGYWLDYIIPNMNIFTQTPIMISNVSKV